MMQMTAFPCRHGCRCFPWTHALKRNRMRLPVTILALQSELDIMKLFAFTRQGIVIRDFVENVEAYFMIVRTCGGRQGLFGQQVFLKKVWLVLCTEATCEVNGVAMIVAHSEEMGN